MTFQSLKKNPLGLADFRDLLRDDYAYADKTRFIEAIDKINFPFIVRPRRFGKSMFTTMLQAYYDKAATDEFDSNFAGTYIPGLPNNVALKPSDLHLFLEFLQKFVAFSSVFIYH